MRRQLLLKILLLLIFANTIAMAEPVWLSKEDYQNNLDFRIEQPLAKTDGSITMSRSFTSEPDIVATFESSVPWASGVNWGGDSYGGAIGMGKNFFGTNLADNQYVSVLIEFSTTVSTLCQTFRRDLSYASAGVGVFPGTAWDMSDPGTPRRLNICFVEDNSLGVANLSWDPDASSYGKREYLFIMLSDYDGTGTTYAGLNAFNDGALMDKLYAWWPKTNPLYSFMQTLPATMTIDAFFVKNFRGIPSDDSTILTWEYYGGDENSFDIYSGPDASTLTLLGSVAGTERQYVHNGLTLGVDTYYQIEALDIVPDKVGISPIIAITTESMSSNMNLIGFLNNRERYGDVWGYTDGLGNEYALICARNEGVSIVDINVMPPVEVGFMPSITPNNDAKDVKIYQNYAVVVKEYEEIQFFDLTDPTSPFEVSTFYPDGGGAHNCLIDGDYLYIIGNHGTGGLEIVDISNPALPVEVGNFQPYYYHDIDIRNDTIAATGIYEDGIDLIDVSNKAVPTLISNWDYPVSGAHNVEFSADGTHLFQGDEIGGSGNHLRVWDISDPMNVNLASEIIVDSSAVVHNCYVYQDTLLVIGHYTEGVRVWNVSNPNSPVEIAHYDTYQPNQYGYLGCWSVYPYFASGKIIASDMQTGLYVLEPDYSTVVSCCDMAGDVNGDATLDIGDLTFTVDFMFRGGPSPACDNDADVNADCTTDISDLTYRVDYMFRGGSALVCGCVGP